MFDLRISWFESRQIKLNNELVQLDKPQYLNVTAITLDEALTHIRNMPTLKPDVKEFYYTLKRK